MPLNKTLLKIVLSHAISCGLLISPSYSQELIKLPKQATETNSTATPNTEPANPTFNSQNPPPTFETINSPRQFNVYRLDTGDGISISVPLFPEFNALATLDPEGNIIIPILGRIALSGLTTTEAEAKISYELGQRFLQQQPEVLVTLNVSRPAQITILGEVVRPGFYNFQAGVPINGVLQTAGGTTQEADLRSVVVRRTLVDGTVLEQKIDLYTPLLTGQHIPSVFIQGGDTIIVSQLQVGEDRNYDRDLIANSTLPQQVITVRILFPSGTGSALRNLNLPNGSTFIDAVASLPPDDNLLIDEDITLLRFDPETRGIISQTLDNREVVKGDISQDVMLQDQDVIVVSRTLLGKVFNTLTIITQPISTFFGFRRFFDFFTDN